MEGQDLTIFRKYLLIGSLDAGGMQWNPRRHDAVRILFVGVKPSGLAHPATFMNLFSKFFVRILASTYILWRFSSFSSVLSEGLVSPLGHGYFISYPFHPPSDWLRLFSSQTFSRINTPTFSTPLILYTNPPMKMEQSVSKRRHIKFRRRGISQKKAYSIQNTAKVWNKNIPFRAFLANLRRLGKRLVASRTSVRVYQLWYHWPNLREI